MKNLMFLFCNSWGRRSVSSLDCGVDFDSIDLSKWFISGEGDNGDNINQDDLTFWSGRARNYV